MNKIYKFLSLVAVFSLTLGLARTTTFASTQVSNTSNILYSVNYSVTNRDQIFLDKLASICDTFYFSNGQLSTRLSDQELKDEYDFTTDEIARLKTDVLDYSTDSFSNSMKLSNNLIAQSSTHVSNGTLYISSHDLKAGSFAILSTAATAGPAAMAAAINALSNMIPAPVGTVIGVIATVAAAPSLVELCGRVLYANAHNKGIYIRPVMSYPPLEIGYW